MKYLDINQLQYPPQCITTYNSDAKINQQIANACSTFVFEILQRLATVPDYDKYEYLITGPSQPKGKTFLCDLLKLNGLIASELSSAILVRYRNEDNDILVDSINMKILIVMNKPIR